jgi:hypothetical protein
MCEKNVSVAGREEKKLHSQPATATTGYATGISPRENTDNVHGHNITYIQVTNFRMVYARIFAWIMAGRSSYLNK